MVQHNMPAYARICHKLTVKFLGQIWDNLVAKTRQFMPITSQGGVGRSFL